ncbi:DUF397 domain-containing protein [Kitasatospora sp. NPDC093102]|uniref:DUF397 domain-containing protein n=1 Tax=Kitasatospora sp. NPDC093102 TaxID=3155069 RepID=UPI003423D735
MLDLTDLYDRADSALYFAPWRPDPRPLEGLLQGTNTNCLEIASDGELVYIRESDDPTTIVTTTRTKLHAWIRGAKAGEFDHFAEARHHPRAPAVGRGTGTRLHSILIKPKQDDGWESGFTSGCCGGWTRRGRRPPGPGRGGSRRYRSWRW